MNRSRGKASNASIAVLALALGGCQALGIGAPRMAHAPDNANPAMIASFGSEQLQLGRTALREGRTVDAIHAFMIAKSFEDLAPDAYNGLAVAYSRLGREDLAERFFQQAVALAPEDTRFRANLATFYVRHGMPRVGEPALALAPAEASGNESAQSMGAAPPAPSARAAVANSASRVRAHTPSPGLRRISRHEVKIAGNTRRVIVEVGGSTAPAQAQTVRVAANGVRTPLRPAKVAYPVRIVLDD